MFKDYPDVLTTEDLAVILHTTKGSVYKLLRRNEIQYRRVLRRYLIRKECCYQGGHVQGNCICL